MTVSGARVRGRRRAGAFFAVFLAAFPAQAAPPIRGGQLQSKQKDLKKITQELSRKESEKQQATRKARELAAEVDRISAELKSSRRALKDAQSRLDGTEKKRRATEERLWASRLGIEQWRDLMSRELALYYQRRAEAEAGRFIELAYRRAALGDKADGLAFALERHAEVESARDELLKWELELQRLRLQREKEQKRVQTAQKQMRGLYRTVQGRRAVLEKEIKDLRNSRRRLERLVKTLIQRERERQKAAQAAAGRRAAPRPPAAARAARGKKGRLPWPVSGRVVERFGRSKHPELDTYVFSNGVGVRPADPAGPVRAVESGEVLYAGEFMSYGLMVLVSHPDDLHTIYAHLGRIGVTQGQKISVGESVGAPGQDDAGRSLVYFELRVGGTAVDPLQWLSK